MAIDVMYNQKINYVMYVILKIKVEIIDMWKVLQKNNQSTYILMQK